MIETLLSNSFRADEFAGKVTFLARYTHDLKDEVDRTRTINLGGGVTIDSTATIANLPALKLVSNGTHNQLYYSADRAMLNANEWTVDAFIRTNAIQTTPTFPIATQYRQGTGVWMLGIRNKKLVFWYSNSDGFYSTEEIADDQWHHVAVSYKDGMARIFIDGRPNGEMVIPTSGRTFDYIGPIYVGTQPTTPVPSGNRLHISHLRITTGVCRYVSAFQVPHLPLPSVR